MHSRSPLGFSLAACPCTGSRLLMFFGERRRGAALNHEWPPEMPPRLAPWGPSSGRSFLVFLQKSIMSTVRVGECLNGGKLCSFMKMLDGYMPTQSYTTLMRITNMLINSYCVSSFLNYNILSYSTTYLYFNCLFTSIRNMRLLITSYYYFLLYSSKK